MLKSTSLRYDIDDRTLFEDVNLECSERSLNILFGPSGSGKSTLIRILAGFTTPTTGEVTLDGDPIEEVPPEQWRRQIVLLHQQPEMFPGTVRRNLILAANYHGDPVEPDRLLNRCQLDVDLDQPAHSLSGGEQKRLALARALSVKPRFLLLDEPTASIHEGARRAIDDLILRLVDDENLGIICVTHDQNEVKRLGSNGYYLGGGRLTKLAQSHLKSGDTP